jgi:translation initiation factor 1
MSHTRLVYSTEKGRVHDAADSASRAPAPGVPVPRDGIIRIFRERGGRGGKTVTVICGLPERGSRPDAFAAELRRVCGTGGTVKDDAIEIQGDHRERVAERLRSLGYRVKFAGG